jgi:hypothetical protein
VDGRPAAGFVFRKSISSLEAWEGIRGGSYAPQLFYVKTIMYRCSAAG